MKGFVFVYGKEVILRFFSTTAFRELSKKHDLTFVALRSSSLLKEGGVDEFLSSEFPKLEWINFYPGRFNRWTELFNISCNLYQERSSSFQIRNQELAKKTPLKNDLLESFTHSDSYKEYREAVEEDMGLHPDILALTLRERPDFFMLPSALLDYCTDDILQIAEKLSIPTAMLIAGWDNLSSKGLLYHLPSVIGVWGEQNRRHAVEIQKIPADHVFLIGAPHYDNFHPTQMADQTKMRASLGLPENRKIILFAGTFRLFDETELLKEIDQAIDSGLLPPMHILYRPHPWRVKRKSEEDYFANSWRHISMDPEIEKTYQTAKIKDRGAVPDDFAIRMNHLENIYQIVDAVISPMSTILLESLLFGLPTMAVAFGDGKHSWSADKVSKMEHFKELYQIPEILVCRNKVDFFQLVNKLITLSEKKNLNEILYKRTEDFVYRDKYPYAQRVANLVDAMLASKAEKPGYDKIFLKPGKTYSPNLLQQGWMIIKKIKSKVWKIIKHRNSN